MSIPFKSVTAASNCSLWLLTSISKGATLVTSLFLVPSMLKTSNEKFIDFVYILLSLTNYSSIPVCVHPESTNALTLSFFLFLVFTSACMFNSCFTLLFQWFGIIYLFWEFIWEISCTVPTRDHCQNSVLSSHLLYLILPRLVISSSTVFLYSHSLYTLLCWIWNIS